MKYAGGWANLLFSLLCFSNVSFQAYCVHERGGPHSPFHFFMFPRTSSGQREQIELVVIDIPALEDWLVIDTPVAAWLCGEV